MCHTRKSIKTIMRVDAHEPCYIFYLYRYDIYTRQPFHTADIYLNFKPMRCAIMLSL